MIKRSKRGKSRTEGSNYKKKIGSLRVVTMFWGGKRQRLMWSTKKGRSGELEPNGRARQKTVAARGVKEEEKKRGSNTGCLLGHAYGGIFRSRNSRSNEGERRAGFFESVVEGLSGVCRF